MSFPVMLVLISFALKSLFLSVKLRNIIELQAPGSDKTRWQA
jgi:hypothetical protein